MIVPPADFWPGAININMNGVTGATPPLSIAGTTISLLNSTGAIITEVSTDNTFAGAVDTKMATQKAIKDYIGSTGFITSVTLPLYVVGTDLRIYDASGTAVGVVNIGAQTFAGNKNFTGYTTITNASSPQFSIINNGANQTDFSVSPTGDITINASGNDINLHSSDVVHVLNNTAASSTTTGALIVNGGVGIGGTSYMSGLNVTSSVSPQFVIGFSGTQWAGFYVSSLGSVSLGATGTDFSTILKVSTSNTTDVAGLTDGSLHTDGGASVAKKFYALEVNALSTAVEQVKARYSGAIYSSLGCDSSGYATIGATGGLVNTPKIKAIDAVGTQLTLQNAPGFDFTAAVNAAGNTVLGSTGGTIFVNNATVLVEQNTTDATGLSDGSLRTSGGASVAKKLYALELNALSIAPEQIKCRYSGAVYSSLGCDSGGVGILKSTGAQINSTRMIVESMTTPQLTIRYSVINQTEIETDSSGNGYLRAAGGLFTVKSGTKLITADTTDSTSTTTGSVQLAGGIGVTGNIYAKKLHARNATNFSELDIADVAATGSCTMTIITGGSTDIITSGNLYWNGALLTTTATQTVAVVWGGALPSVASNLYFTRSGNQVTLRFGQAVNICTSTASIVSDVEIPAAFRPPVAIYQSMFVRYNSLTTGVGQVGLFTTYATGVDWKITLWSDAIQTPFPIATNCGLDPGCITWSTY